MSLNNWLNKLLNICHVSKKYDTVINNIFVLGVMCVGAWYLDKWEKFEEKIKWTLRKLNYVMSSFITVFIPQEPS